MFAGKRTLGSLAPLIEFTAKDVSTKRLIQRTYVEAMDTTEMFSLEALTVERIDKAFEKARNEANFPGSKLVLITEDHYAAAIQFMKEIICRDEPVSKACGIVSTWGPETDDLWKTVFNGHMSFMLINEETGDIIGMRATTTGKDGTTIGADNFTEDGTKRLLAFCQYGTARANFFEHFGVTEQIHFMGLGVHDKYRRLGLASKLMDVAMNMVKHLGFESVPLQVEGTSNFSKRIFEKLGFEILYEQPFDEYLVDGKQVVYDTGEHTSLKVYGLCISNK